MSDVTRWAIAFDNHGNKAVKHVVETFFSFIDDFKPTIRIHGGDCFNFAALRKGASDQDKREAMADDFDAGIKFIERYKPTVFLRGNHDERLYDATKSDDGKVRDYADSLTKQIKAALAGCPMIEYNKRKGVYQLGDHKVIHGYNCGMYAARHAAAAYGHVLMGHVHTDNEQSVARIEGAKGHSFGCMCELDQDYNRGHLNTLAQCHGWAYGFLYPSGAVQVVHAKQIDGRWILPTDFKEVRYEQQRGSDSGDARGVGSQA